MLRKPGFRVATDDEPVLAGAATIAPVVPVRKVITEPDPPGGMDSLSQADALRYAQASESAGTSYLPVLSFLMQRKASLPADCSLEQAGRLAAARTLAKKLPVKKLPGSKQGFVLCYPVTVLEELFLPIDQDGIPRNNNSPEPPATT